jgi:hypothetical protein
LRLKFELSSRCGLGSFFADAIAVTPMKKRKKKTLDVGQVARRRARESGVAPSTTRVIQDKRERAPKHKKPLRSDDSI